MMTERDLDLLSAYLDGALSSEDQAALEARLQTDPALREELETLRATVGLLRGLPTLQAPRSFTLTREQARRERGARVTGYIVHSAAFRALSAAAVALIVFGAAILTVSSNLAMPPAALQPAPTLVIAAQPTLGMPTDDLPGGADAAVLPSQPAGESAAEAMLALPTSTLPVGADAEAPLLYAAPATIAADTFAAQPEAAAGSVQRAAEEQESATAAANMMDTIPVTSQPDGLPSIAATLVPAQPTMPPAAGLAVPSTPLPTQPPATATPAPTQTLPPTATLTASPSPTPAPTVMPPAPLRAVSTLDIGLLLVIGGVVLFALALGLALLRGRVRG